jgi:tetratricopeptide (TPR) repeat protein
MALFVRYFRLAGNDLLIDEKGKLSISRTSFVILVLIWPILVLSGWLIYPFLITGFLWTYLSNNEKKTVSILLVLIFVLSIFYSMNLSFERKISSRNFKITQSVNNGKLFDKDEYDRFDDELKVIQAYSFYVKNRSDTALNILESTGENYQSVLKYNLMGNIYFRSGDIPASIRAYKESLNLDDNNDTTLNNFTLALMKTQNPEASDLWAKRYPGLKKYKNAELKLKEVKKISGILWKRLFDISGNTFDIPSFLGNILSEFFKLPVIYCILLFIAYSLMIRKMYPDLGECTYCSKCSKIIKKTKAHRSNKLCEECHQLFLIKDVIFLEAKVLKEKELNRKFRRKYIVILLLSILVPGFNLNYRNKKWLFVMLATIIYVLLGFSIIGIITFNKIFSTSPIFFNFIGAFAVILFFFVNLFSVLGEENGI